MRASSRLVVLSLAVLPFAAPLSLGAQVASPALSSAPVSALTPTAIASPVADPATPPAIVTAPVDSSATAATAAAGAPLDGLRAGVHNQETAPSLQPAMVATHANLGQSRAMMVVGVAGLIVGAIIGGTPGTVIMVGGAVVGLVGLYDYLQ